MSKIERLNARVEKLLSKAVQEVLEVVKETVSEYQEKTTRTQRENQSLKRRLQELQEQIHLESNGKSHFLFYFSLTLKECLPMWFAFSIFVLPCRSCGTNTDCIAAG